MKVEELIKALSEQPQDAEVFYLTGDSGMYQVNTVKSATAVSEEVKEITGKEFVVLSWKKARVSYHLAPWQICKPDYSFTSKQNTFPCLG